MYLELMRAWQGHAARHARSCACVRAALPSNSAPGDWPQRAHDHATPEPQLLSWVEDEWTQSSDDSIASAAPGSSSKPAKVAGRAQERRPNDGERRNRAKTGAKSPACQIPGRKRANQSRVPPGRASGGRGGMRLPIAQSAPPQNGSNAVVSKSDSPDEASVQQQGGFRPPSRRLLFPDADSLTAADASADGPNLLAASQSSSSEQEPDSIRAFNTSSPSGEASAFDGSAGPGPGSDALGARTSASQPPSAAAASAAAGVYDGSRSAQKGAGNFSNSKLERERQRPAVNPALVWDSTGQSESAAVAPAAITRSIKGCRSLEALKRLLDSYEGSFNHIHISAALVHLVRLKQVRQRERRPLLAVAILNLFILFCRQ